MTIPPPAVIRRVAYLGTPAIAVPPLEALVEAGFDVAVVISGPDRRRGRGGEVSPSPVKQAALELGIPVSTEIDDVLEVDADLGVVVAFGQLIPAAVLDRLAMVNIHFSLLPRWRGAAPVERAILAGDEETGVCLMVVDQALDTGAVYRRETVAIDPDETATELRERLIRIGSDQLIDALRDGLGSPVPQDGDAVYAAKISAGELEIDWYAPALDIHRLVRVGGAWTTFRTRRLKVLRTSLIEDRTGDSPEPGRLAGCVVGTGDGSLELIEVQPEGRSRQAAADWERGARISGDERLGS